MQTNHIASQAIFHIELEDGSSNEMTVRVPHEGVRKAILILPAMGVRASFYDHFCDEMAKTGLIVASVDWRGLGKSSVRAGRRSNWGYARLIWEVEYYSTWLKRKFDLSHLYLVGHSMGEQVAQLTAARFPILIQGVISVASSDPYFRGWKGKGAIAFFLSSYLIRPVSFFMGHFPGYLFGFAKREARTVMRDWSRAVRKGFFNPRSDTFDYREAKLKYKGIVNFIAIPNDILATMEAIKYTQNKFSMTSQSTIQILEKSETNEFKYDHFNWAKHTTEAVRMISNMLNV